MGNKNPQKHQNPYKSLDFFHIFRGWKACKLIIMSSETMHVLPDQVIPHNSTVTPGPWIFYGCCPSPLRCRCSAKSTECPASEASFYMLTLYLQHYGPILLMEKTGTGFRLPYHKGWWDCAGDSGEALERFTVVPPTWGKLILVIRNLYLPVFFMSLHKDEALS